MDIHTQATLLAAIVSLALTGAALLRDNRPRVFTLFAVFSGNLGLFCLCDFLQGWPGAEIGIDLWERLTVALGALLPASALAFFLEFLGVAHRPARRARNAMLGGSLTGFVVAASPLVHHSAAKLVVSVYVLGGMAAVLTVLWNRMRSAPTRVERARLLYLFVGACIAVVLCTLDVLPRFGLSYPPRGLGAITLTLFMFFLSQTLLRHRLLDLHEFLGKIVVVTALGLVLVAIYGGLVSWVGSRTELFYFNTLVASFVILSLFEPMREKVEEWVVVTLFRERYELVRQLEALRERLSTVIDPARLASVLLDGLAETRRVTHASLWLLAEDRPGYRLVESRGPPPAAFLEPAGARALLGAAGSGQKAIMLENIERRLAELHALIPPGPADDERTGAPPAIAEELNRLLDAREAMRTMAAGITMPLSAGDRILGFLACRDERVPEAFASNEIAALLGVADRAALVIENSKLYQQMKERDRLAALGEMAAGLAHEIRNPLAAIQGAIQLLLPPPGAGGATPPGGAGESDGPTEFLGIIADEVKRLNGVVTQFLDYSRPVRPSLSPTDVNEILRRTLVLLQADIPQQVELAVELAAHLPRVSGDAEQLRQVFLNLALNAVQAMPGGGKLSIATRLARDEAAVWREGSRGKDLVEIRFRDTGPGIPEDARDHIFVPFYTTKEKGTGLGLAICQRIVKTHGGDIAVRSAPGRGSEFVIALPALREEREEPSQDRHPPEAGQDRGRRWRARR